MWHGLGSGNIGSSFRILSVRDLVQAMESTKQRHQNKHFAHNLIFQKHSTLPSQEMSGFIGLCGSYFIMGMHVCVGLPLLLF